MSYDEYARMQKDSDADALFVLAWLAGALVLAVITFGALGWALWQVVLWYVGLFR